MVSRFLNLIPYHSAQEILKKYPLFSSQNERIQVTKSVGRITHEPAYAKITVPPAATSLRDGYAVMALDTLHATETKPIEIKNCALVHTGSPIPAGYDAVIMQEEVRIDFNCDGSDRISILKPARSGQHIKKAGSEVVVGTMIVPAGHLISAVDIGALVEYGVTTVSVRKVSVALISTGNEVREPCTAPKPGEVIESNSSLFSAFFAELGIEPVVYPIVPDSKQEIQNAIEQATLDCDFVILFGGTSTGRRDFTKAALNDRGTILYHGVSIRPGKTTLSALVNDRMVFGVPGTPAGALCVLERLIMPWLSYSGFPKPQEISIQATLAESIPSELGTDDFVSMVVGKVGTKYQAVLAPRGHGQMSAVKTNGVLHIKLQSEGLKKGTENLIHLTRTFPHPDDILLALGVPNLITGIFDQFLRKYQMSLYCRQTGFEMVLLSMQNRSYHGGIIERPHINMDFCKIDYSLLSEGVSLIHIADQQYILASREDLGENREIIYPNLPEGSYLSHFMRVHLRKHPKIPETSSISVKDEVEVIEKIKKEELGCGPCSEHLAAEYCLSGPVIGSVSIDFIVRNEDLETEHIRCLQKMLESDEWKHEVDMVAGYSAKRSGDVSSLS
jgi:putative molybdopterin biosynthesis protein